MILNLNNSHNYKLINFVLNLTDELISSSLMHN
jgi:hypothetical protein